jgi:hypothetical protein
MLSFCFIFFHPLPTIGISTSANYSKHLLQTQPLNKNYRELDSKTNTYRERSFMESLLTKCENSLNKEHLQMYLLANGNEVTH